MDDNKVHVDVKEYYGKILTCSGDLQTNACTIKPKKVAKPIREAMSLVHDDVASRYYGCGLVIPDSLEKMSILDLGCGAGHDCFILSKLVGRDGHVTGIDMTEEQISIANQYVDHHTKVFGYSQPNINFITGYIENLRESGIEDSTFDIIISNCVVNLCPDKRSVLQEAFRVLKPGGEMYFSDIYCDKRLSPELQKHKILWGEGLSGALWWKDLISIAEEVGFCSPRMESSTVYKPGNKELEKLVEGYNYVSTTYRLFKPGPGNNTDPGLVMYDGSIDNCQEQFKFDLNYIFKANEETCVDEETFSVLENSRFRNNFIFKKGADSCCSAPALKPLDPFVKSGSVSSNDNCVAKCSG